MLHELDRVELARPVDHWAAGTRATVVDVPRDGFATVEVDNDLLDPGVELIDALLDVPESAVRVTARHPQHA